MNQNVTSTATAEASPLSAPAAPTSAPAPTVPASAPRPALRARYWEHIDPASRSLYPVD